ncbi:hypothetical protein A3K29_03560 [Candidatus Collierbacteria bacterium RIFOXYB2_FULL_46_14]|uniref:MazG nucleotide pyrophosphohydrolase n=1 Tax=Candidatus Collierbacteria bacterium GW2011_GWA2_46_26 TaxID=1618381 RepID=A0A0G1PM30_9BACT|nr:MAG: hypothetical protein UW29_C0004G0218 [Candidatus Collierbacteria bacterium GW2011_GWC2_44_13]KKU33732.1 MAG: hypothetical protein UX47_C0001G0015 [Candidatus Collierbacteria bacterium GW2011_GWA2_46_26]OGD73195.1 MAG: hypothetical protein A3K29_03560 [Candidatus Collierbacteria bacterium RIFOXYB2_FULL_46_14]OGD76237.1 MAG: hypothetical protein A3K43_03560 [Candidatus Collierbacteria bacterium RIFOXYA2_FULL_46_20]OGD77573.1 MAG: hypothetical protein A3K39_03560 [Candidatus Collierbacteri
MKLNEIAALILKQAEEKGWSHTKELLSVAEKTMLMATEISELREATLTEDYLYFYGLVTNAYDYYRHKDIENFLRSLKIIALEIRLLAQNLKLNLDSACLNKIEINQTRVWNKNQLNGNYYKTS